MIEIITIHNLILKDHLFLLTRGPVCGELPR